MDNNVAIQLYGLNLRPTGIFNKGCLKLNKFILFLNMQFHKTIKHVWICLFKENILLHAKSGIMATLFFFCILQTCILSRHTETASDKL